MGIFFLPQMAQMDRFIFSEHESHELHEYLLNPCESVLSTGDLFGDKDIKTTETAALT